LQKPKAKNGMDAIFSRARDRSGIFAPKGQKLERIARFFAAGRKKCAQIDKFNRAGPLNTPGTAGF
jgi:hypothetical protein